MSLPGRQLRSKCREGVEAALDPVPQRVSDCIDEDWFFAIDLAGDDRRAAALFDDAADEIAVVGPVGPVGNEHFLLQPDRHRAAHQSL